MRMGSDRIHLETGVGSIGIRWGSLGDGFDVCQILGGGQCEDQRSDGFCRGEEK